MGNGIAQISAVSGYEVRLRDLSEELLGQARKRIETSLARVVKSGKLTEEQAAAALARISFETSIETAVDGVDIVIEAVPEILELKHEIFQAIVAAAPADALLGTNTSQLSITSIGSVLGDDAERLVGTHFFNPPVMMRLVEIVRGLATSDDAIERAIAYSEALGKEWVICQKDSPGFITTRAYAALRVECLKILEEGVATAEDVDKALRLGFNFPMGPFELSDFNGLDIFWHVSKSLIDAYGDRFRPTIGYKNMVTAGRIGRKVGQGYYKYDADGNRLPAPEAGGTRSGN